jgi:hypothetical protein
LIHESLLKKRAEMPIADLDILHLRRVRYICESHPASE